MCVIEFHINDHQIQVRRFTVLLPYTTKTGSLAICFDLCCIILKCQPSHVLINIIVFSLATTHSIHANDQQMMSPPNKLTCVHSIAMSSLTLMDSKITNLDINDCNFSCFNIKVKYV